MLQCIILQGVNILVDLGAVQIVKYMMYGILETKYSTPKYLDSFMVLKIKSSFGKILFSMHRNFFLLYQVKRDTKPQKIGRVINTDSSMGVTVCLSPS